MSKVCLLEELIDTLTFIECQVLFNFGVSEDEIHKFRRIPEVCFCTLSTFHFASCFILS